MIGKLFGNQQSRHQALRNLVDQFDHNLLDGQEMTIDGKFYAN
jgi:hypothetical protein